MPRMSIPQMSFAKVYPLLVQKAERKGRTKDEVDQLVFWLTGHDAAGLQAQLEADARPSTAQIRQLKFLLICKIIYSSVVFLLIRKNMGDDNHAYIKTNNADFSSWRSWRSAQNTPQTPWIHPRASRRLYGLQPTAYRRD